MKVLTFLLFSIHSSLLTQGFLSSTSVVKSFRTMSTSSNTSISSKPFTIVVDAEINPDRMDEFLAMIEKNAVGSRQEPDCLRFDVVQSHDNPNRFFFYEVYKSADAINHHKAQSHYQAWVSFKESGGVKSSVTSKGDGLFFSG